ncbi:hypothetical protein OV207_23080 [Corallococcus sp. BB11-1]|uniref:hypothetical protein n=1 Tax=Corallococcus sp. BB11-1 TaxID=2996783 RepID=UPI0022717D98|nr:hypothetical protein [Corallococcus sp. BB11-1]MCY1034355.1 hypothetical protein [Corallococcus sp. BB11-1]
MKKSMLLVALAFSMFGSTALANEAACSKKAPQPQASSSRQEAPAKEATTPDFSKVDEAPQAEACFPAECATNADCSSGLRCRQKCCVVLP